MIERVNPIFAKDQGRKARYQITDNFLAAWLAAIARNVQLARIRPVDEAIARADDALKTHEGYAFEKLVRLALEECSRKGVGDFSLTQLVRGYWNKPDGTDIEIDVVAINENDKKIRVGSCKRAATKHNSESLLKFNEHISRFQKTELGKRYADWSLERALYSPAFDVDQRKALSAAEYICVDMNDFDKWLRPA